MPPTLVLMPGLHGTAGLFGPFLAALPAGVPVHVIEYPTDEVCDYDALAARAGAALAGVGEMVLLGESFSGAVAARLAAAHPGRVRGLVLAASFVRPPVPRVLCYLATPLILARCPIPRAGVRAFLAGRRAPRELVDGTLREVRRLRPGVLAHRVRLAASCEGADALRQCRCPVLYLQAERDRLIGARAARRVCRARPDVVLRAVDGPHLLLQTRPAACWGHVARFLADHGVAYEGAPGLSPAAPPAGAA